MNQPGRAGRLRIRVSGLDEYRELLRGPSYRKASDGKHKSRSAA